MSDPQLLLFLKAFTETEQTKLAMLSGILLANGTLPATILTSLFTDNIVKEGNFLYNLFFSYIIFNQGCILLQHILYIGSLQLCNRNQYFKGEAYTDSNNQCTLWNLIRGQSNIGKKRQNQKWTLKNLCFLEVCRIVEYRHYSGNTIVWTVTSIPDICLLAFFSSIANILCMWVWSGTESTCRPAGCCRR